MKPPVCNHGGKVPTEGDRRAGDRVRPDWVRLTFIEASIEDLATVLSLAFGVGVDPVPRDRGLLGFERSCEFFWQGVSLARYAYGGAAMRGRAMLEISGASCERVAAWSEIVEFVEGREGRLTRLDLALDTESVSVDQVVAAWREGAFNGRGRPPTATLVDDLGSGAGRTFYVGRRGGDRMVRAYEKGKQLGDKASNWVRVELELLAATTVLPLAGMLDAERLFAGAYEFLARLVPVAGTRPDRVRRATVATVAKAVEVARQQVGGVVGYLCGVAGLSVREVVKMLWRPPSPRIHGAVVDPGYVDLVRWARLEPVEEPWLPA